MTGFSLNVTAYCNRALPSNESRNCTAPSGLASATPSAAGSWAAKQSRTSSAIRIGIWFLSRDSATARPRLQRAGILAGKETIPNDETRTDLRSLDFHRRRDGAGPGYAKNRQESPRQSPAETSRHGQWQDYHHQVLGPVHARPVTSSARRRGQQGPHLSRMARRCQQLHCPSHRMPISISKGLAVPRRLHPVRLPERRKVAAHRQQANRPVGPDLQPGAGPRPRGHGYE